MNYKIGSLFDGSGGFPLAGALCGVEPCWAAEVEPYPIAVTRSRFPNMKHLGDISKVNGGEIEPVDIITFGSPCQDLSVAGKRAGLKHEANGDEETTRSGLFMEAVRIIKEMRAATNGKYPTFALWENVPGAFSSNKGEDFRVVCEELVKIVEPSASMPSVPKGGWSYADSYVGDGWSLAYRVFDAQYWGVPQRRRRIHLVADFSGQRAREVLFEREGVRGYFTEGRTPWQATPADAQGGPGADDREGEGFDGYNGDLTGGVSTGRNGVVERGRQLDAVAYAVDQGAGKSSCSVLEDKAPTLATTHGGSPAVAVPYTLKIRGGVEVDSTGKTAGKGALIQKDLSATLGVSQDQYLFQPVPPPVVIHQHAQTDSWTLEQENLVQTLTSRMGTGGGNVPMVMEPFCKSARAQTKDDATTWKHGEVANTLNTFDQGEARANELVVMATQQGGAEITENGVCPTITAAAGMSGNNQPVIDFDRAAFNQGQNAKYDFEITDSGVNSTLVAKGPSGVAYACSSKQQSLVTSENTANTLGANDYKEPQAVVYPETPIRYIVRRLTPTECARLQGFADWWGIVDQKDSLTDEEYQFWLEVRNTHATINGKKVQDYTKAQMLTWYNKLWTDSSEYKMWGNGIALPTALYCLQGIVEALNKPEDDDSWLM